MNLRALSVVSAVAALAVIASEARAAVTYSTDFNLVESPISEAGAWRHDGLDWAHVATARGLAYGTQTGNGGFDDSYAYLSGFPPDQSASAVVHRDPATGGTTHEVEILLRWSDSAHSARGYECNFAYDGSYASIVRWNGPKSDFTVIDPAGGPGRVAGGLHDGDVVKAQIVGSVITTFINGKPLSSTTDTVYRDGNPGIGLWRGAPSAPIDDFALTSFEATSQTSSVGVPASVPTRLTWRGLACLALVGAALAFVWLKNRR